MPHPPPPSRAMRAELQYSSYGFLSFIRDAILCVSSQALEGRGALTLRAEGGSPPSPGLAPSPQSTVALCLSHSSQ